GQQGVRQQATYASRPERQQVYALVALNLAQEQTRNQKSGDDKENINTNIPAAEPRHARVVEHDGGNRYRSQAFDVGSEAARLQESAPLTGSASVRWGEAASKPPLGNLAISASNANRATT